MSIKKSFKTVRYFFEYMAVLSLYYSVRFMPKFMLGIIADIVGRAAFLIPAIGGVAKANVASAFPEKSPKETRTIARKSISSIILSLLEFFWFTERPERLSKYVDFDGAILEMSKETRETGKGFILVTPHLGTWEVAGLIMSQFAKINFAVVVRITRNPFLNKLINSGRMIEGNKVIPAKGAIKGMMKALKEGYSMGTLIDQNTKARDGGIFVDFFGMPVPTSRAPALFGRKMNTKIVVGGTVRTGNRYENFVIPLPKNTDEYTDDTELIQDLMKATEDMVRKYPDQYLWFYKRFQHIPEDAPEEIVKRYPFYAEKVTPRFYSNNAPKEEK